MEISGLEGMYQIFRSKSRRIMQLKIQTRFTPIMLLQLYGDLVPNLNIDSNVVPSIVNPVLGHTELKPNKPKSTWTRMVRMNVGPSDIANNTFKPTMGKRGLGDVLFEDCNKETEVGS